MDGGNDHRKNRRDVGKIFNGCSEPQRHAYFYVGDDIILTDVRVENIGTFGTTID